MIRSLALSLLFALSVSLVAPALAPTPARAATGTEVAGGLPPIPWQKVGQWVLKNALTLVMLAEEIWRDIQHGQDPQPGGSPNTPPPMPLTVELG